MQFDPLAASESVEAQRWYEDRVPGLGDRLLGPRTEQSLGQQMGGHR